MREIHRIIQSRLLEYFNKDHLPELIFKKIIHLKYPISSLFSTVVETLIVRWERFSVQQPSLYNDVSTTYLGLNSNPENKGQNELKILVGSFNDYRILEKETGDNLVIFEDISRHMVALQIKNDRIVEIFFTDSSKGDSKRSDLSGLWLRLIAWFMNMSLKH